MTFCRSAKSRLPLLIAVALISAAVGDPLVETISDSRVFGNGYADNNHLSVIPTLIAGALLAALLIWQQCIALLHDPAEHSDWLRGVAKEISAHSLFHDLPFILTLQFGALFMMESCEQLCVGGKLLNSAAWLGGPIWFSLATHVLLGSCFALLIRHAMSAILRRCAALVRIALEFMADAFARENSSSFARHRHSSGVRFNRTSCVHQIGCRAPPLLLALT